MTTIMLPFQKFSNDLLKRKLCLFNPALHQNLVISDLDELGPNLLALDKVKRILFYAHDSPAACSCLIVDLNHLKKCTVKMEFNNIHAGKLGTRSLHHYLKSIFLNLVFRNGSESVSLPLFDAMKQKQPNAEQVVAKAKKWEIIISKLLSGLTIKPA